MKVRHVLLILAILVLLVSGAFALLQASLRGLSPLPQQRISLADPSGKSRTLSVEVAQTSAEHERGLMFRTSVTHGMLFVFPAPEHLSFWMKNTLVPLDIVFFDGSGVFLNTQGMTPCAADPCPSYVSVGTAQYALEMPAGYVKQAGIGRGWTLRIPSSK